VTKVEDFGSWAPHYDGGALQATLYHPMHEAVIHEVQRVRRPRRLLDLGCGTGHLLALAARRLPTTTLVGADLCGPMLDVAARRTIRTLLVQADAANLPFPDGSFEAITCTATIRHWADLDRGLAEAARVLAEDGLLAVGDFFPLGRSPAWLPARRATGLPAHIQAALSQAGLCLAGARAIDGYGPIGGTTVALARRISTANR
jgi:ubiquinone/menaquinone biosynthesis C-methylase UbiE